jgi:chromosome segregation ATPase
MFWVIKKRPKGLAITVTKSYSRRKKMRKQYGVFLSIMFFMFLVLVGASAEQAEDRVSGEDVKREMRELLATLKAYTFEQKEDYQNAIEGKLRDIDARIETLQARSAKARACLQTHHGPAPLLDPALSESRVRATLQTRPSTEAQAELREKITELRDKREVVRRKLQALRTASAQSWEDMKAGIAAAANDLAQAYDDAVSHFR